MKNKLQVRKNGLVTFGIFAALALSLFTGARSAHAMLLTQELDLGMTNSDVSALQGFLATNSAFYPQGIISGYFGNLTAAAVSRFQIANGLPAVGRVGARTLAIINAQVANGVTTGGTDDSAPIIYPESVSVGTNWANVSWATSEAARSRVMYATFWPFLYATASSVSGPGLASTANITLPNLAPHTMYYYVRESIDATGNIMWTTKNTFWTAQ